MTITLKYPEGEFTQSELATLNGMEKPVVYPLLKEDQENGIIEKVGTRPTGKRPANLYKFVSNNAPVVVPVPVMPQPSVDIPPASETPPVVNPEPILPEAVILAKELDKAIQKHHPLEANPVPAFETALKNAVIDRLTPNPAYPCPICKGSMTEIPDATGVTVKCYSELCDSTENTYGHARTAQAAWEIAKQKFHA